ncbi:serine/threonine-protein kinase [Actinomadura rayongensis]|uniref:Protein kinase n=1 Tax=Actinomadura rayongensis TaxID=1429076 RepID=A0A6I4W895_9ACTN|nr:serine/threonine-protein kinase [Actinomadura rayongensis]MXQ62952.1 protein kinase [Actinomadura rayongensis]
MSSVNMDEPRPLGERLGRYRLKRLLGSGGMGAVYLAEDGNGHRVAIKVIHSRLSGQDEFRERFRREVTAARRVRPFCTAPVLDADTGGDPLYLVTEFVPGPTLEDVVVRNGPLRGADLDGLAVGVATALSAIHAAGVVHRDLKPANILLSPYGPRVIDFGIARTLATDGAMTKTGQSMGTPSFMAPEGLTGRPITEAADVFTWGCVVAWAGTGALPFPGRNVGEILYRTVHGEPRLDGLAEPMRGLVARALAKEPHLRPTAPDLLRELTGDPNPARSARTTAPSGPQRPSFASDGRTRLLTRGRRRLVPPLVVLAATAVVAGTAYSLWPDGDGSAPGLSTTLFRDDFSDRTSGWKEGGFDDYYHRYEKSGYVVSVDSTLPFDTAEAPVPTSTGNLAIEAAVRVDSTNPDDEGGLYCEGAGHQRVDVMLARNGFITIRRASLTDMRDLIRSSTPAARPATTVRLRVDCRKDGGGTSVRAWVNGRSTVSTVVTDIGETEETGLVAGRPGRPYAPPATVAFFDDVVVGRP